MVKATVEFDGETKVYEGDFFAGAVMAYQGDECSSHGIVRGEANIGDAVCAVVRVAASIEEEAR